MAKTARPIDWQKLKRIKDQLENTEYINNAVDTMAHHLTSYLVDSQFENAKESSQDFFR